MAINLSAELKRTDMSQLEYTYDLLSGLTDDELDAIQAVAIAFLKRDRGTRFVEEGDDVVPFQAQTEEQLIARIDHSLEQIKNGQFQDSEEFEKELFAEIDA